MTGKHITVALIRGVKQPWKQIIACEVTRASTAGQHMKEFVEKCINFIENSGLLVVAVSSDMGSNNRALWSHLGISGTRDAHSRQNKFIHNGHDIYIYNS